MILEYLFFAKRKLWNFAWGVYRFRGEENWIFVITNYLRC